MKITDTTMEISAKIINKSSKKSILDQNNRKHNGDKRKKKQKTLIMKMGTFHAYFKSLLLSEKPKGTR